MRYIRHQSVIVIGAHMRSYALGARFVHRALPAKRLPVGPTATAASISQWRMNI